MSSNFLNDENKGDIIIYQSESGETKIDVRFQDETVWLTQAQMEELFQSSHANVVEHIKNIYSEGELDESSTCRKFRQVRREGNRNVERERLYYNLDMIISLGYRIRSSIATQFRRWATERLKEYMIKGFAMDDERLKNLGGGSYWKELLDRIRDIRSSEKVMYRQVLDLYATSVDYDPKSAESVAFFKMVQNKLHYAVTGMTAAELISWFRCFCRSRSCTAQTHRQFSGKLDARWRGFPGCALRAHQSNPCRTDGRFSSSHR